MAKSMKEPPPTTLQDTHVSGWGITLKMRILGLMESDRVNHQCTQRQP